MINMINIKNVFGRKIKIAIVESITDQRSMLVLTMNTIHLNNNVMSDVSWFTEP